MAVDSWKQLFESRKKDDSVSICNYLSFLQCFDWILYSDFWNEVQLERSKILGIIFQLKTNALALIVAEIMEVANDIVHCAERATNGSSLPCIVHKEFALAD